MRPLRGSRGQTTVEYTLIVAFVALPLAMMFMRYTSRWFLMVCSVIVKKFTGMY